MSGRIWVWFIPPRPPTSALISAQVSVRVGLVAWNKKMRVSIGISFCHVVRSSPVGHGIEFITDGNQK